MMEAYITSYYCRVKYTTNHYRLMDIAATSSSRRQELKQVAHLRALPGS